MAELNKDLELSCGCEMTGIARNDAIESIQQLVKTGLLVSPDVLVEVFISME